MVRMYFLVMSNAKKSLVETVSFDPSGWRGLIEKMGESNIVFCTLTISSIAPMVVIVMKTSDGKS